ncbi:MAG TPA: glycoside hydrolase family 99-like domain-containing protein [Thermodesulfobacteriota bacterium]|nr:glycoside hydrolase family 99-like domain-containing protein [Thermodesulfobacteriota bacterium]
MDRLARVIAYYLPQFHPIPENDEWWGKGFTEWTNVARAKPLFPGHYQPHVPADLGFYDLRLPETRIAQAELARHYGLEGFCYYHYWFGGRRLLEKPFEEVLASGVPDFPFCLCWANETWAGRWHGLSGRTLVEQTYPGQEDEEKHFHALLRAFQDRRYIRVNGKPVFVVYRPFELPNPKQTTDFWRELAGKNGLPGLYLIGVSDDPLLPMQVGFDASTPTKYMHPAGLGQSKGTRKIRRLIRNALGFPVDLYSYPKIYPYLTCPEAARPHVHPCVIPNWDNSPRCGKQAVILHGSTPEWFRKHFRTALRQVLSKPEESRFIFVKSWNEWAEGNHLEPDLKYGHAYLEVLRQEITNGFPREGPHPAARRGAKEQS